jgi:glyoxylase-like metal-dependent hydrolase (beta-lactamase superfamily II)
LKRTGDLFHRGILREESGYFVLRQSMPYPLAENNSYLIETGSGWAVIDVGVDLPATREVWSQAVQEIGIPFAHIAKIYITHCHPDHLGAAQWLQQVSEAPVFMLDEEIRRADDFIFIEDDFENTYRRAIEDQCRRHDFAPRLVDELIRAWHHEVTPLFPRPEVLLPLQVGQQVELRGEAFQIMPAPGHADGQFMLWNASINHLFSADLISADSYLHFTDSPNTRRSNPVAALFRTIDELLALGEPLVFPGHGASFRDLPGRLEGLRRRHLRQLERIKAALRAPVTAGELYPGLYELVDYVHLHRLVIGETMGYLEYLQASGEIQKLEQDGRVLFGR